MIDDYKDRPPGEEIHDEIRNSKDIIGDIFAFSVYTQIIYVIKIVFMKL